LPTHILYCLFFIKTDFAEKVTFCPTVSISVMPFRFRMRIRNVTSTFALQKPMASESEYFGEIARARCIWANWTPLSKISTFRHSHRSHMISRSDVPISPVKMLNVYVGHHTTWYFHCLMACSNFLNFLIEYLLLILRVTILKNLMDVFCSRKALTCLHSIPLTIP
jgi:hypothetical protein